MKKCISCEEQDGRCYVFKCRFSHSGVRSENLSGTYQKPIRNLWERVELVGMTRFELATSGPPDRCATGLRHIPYQSRRGDSNARPPRPERGALPTALLLEFFGLSKNSTNPLIVRCFYRS